MKALSNLGAKGSLWGLSFRPFFLFGSVFSLLAMALWIAQLFSGLPYHGSLIPITWHSHEMVYGFTTAIIAGFVLTAVQNWSGKRGVHGGKLQILFVIWLLPRILLAIYPHPSLFVSGLDLLFFPLLASYLAPYLLRDPDLKMERIFILYFAVFFLGNLLVHLDSLGYLTGYSTSGIRLGLHVVVIIIIFMGGRVIPFFTESTLAKKQPKTYPVIEVSSHLSAWLFLISAFFAPTSYWTAGIAFSAALIHAIRLYGWYVRRIRRVAIIWILHVAYLWIAVGFLLSGLASLGVILPTLAIHAFTAGAIGAVIYGMITRVSLGHTGRPLRASKPILIGYVLLTLSAVLRVFGPMIDPFFYKGSLIAAGGLWILAFLLFVYEYEPILTSPRVDGKVG